MSGLVKITILVTMIFGLSLACIAYIIYRNPVRTGIFIQRSLLSVYGLSKKTLNTVNGRLIYFEGGKGRPLILVHGFAADAGNWYRVVPGLIKNFHLIIPDMPGHGESDPQTDTLTPENLLEGMLGLIDEKSGSQKVIIVGNSMGGWLSMMSVLKRQHKISMLILENAAGLKNPLPETLLLPKDPDSVRKLYHFLLGDEAPAMPEFLYKHLIAYIGQTRFTSLFNSIKDEYFLDNKLSSVRIPVYLLWGGSDRLFPHDYAFRLQKEISGSQLIMVESTGHAMHFTRPGEFVDNLLKITGEK